MQKVKSKGQTVECYLQEVDEMVLKVNSKGQDMECYLQEVDEKVQDSLFQNDNGSSNDILAQHVT